MTNAGAAPAVGTWTDRLTLNSVQLAARVREVGPLAAGAGYTVTAEVTIPANVAGGAQTLQLSVDDGRELGESNEGNNTRTATVDVGSANLVVQSFTVTPTAVEPGQAVTATWTVRNAGTTPAVADWTDRLFLADSATASLYYASAVASEVVGAPTPLAPGAAYTVSKTFTVPAGTPSGPRYVVLFADAATYYYGGAQGETNESDNTAAAVVQVGAPDLVVTAATAPAVLTLGQSAAFTWTVKNTLTASAAADWTDAVYLSADAVLDNSDVLVLTESVAAQTPLAGGASYTVSRTAAVPTAAGTYRYVLFAADRNGSQGEANDANNTFAVPVTVRGPDLTVASVVAPPAARSGEPFTLTWTVTNTGAADATGTWTDRVSTSKDRFGVNRRILGDFAFTGTIPAGGSVTRTQTVTLPPDLVGGFYLHVAANAGGLAEADTANNTALTPRKTQFGQQEYPDLKVTAATAPPQAFSGKDAVVTWAVTNAGAGATSAPAWYDRVWLSTDATLDAGDTFLGDAENPAYLPAGEGYNAALTVRLPRGIDGTYYLLVEADARGQVFELGRDANNRTASAAFTITLTPPPDLKVTGVVAPTTTFSGQPTTVSWAVTNAGPATEETGWADEVFLSADDRVDGSDRSLGRVIRSGALAKDGTYTASLVVATPLETEGTFYFLVRTDSQNQVFEHAFEANNVGRDDPTRVLLTPPPDLEVTDVTVPAAATAGKPLAFRYTVANAGATRVAGGWTDAFYLSTSATLDTATARLLGTRGNAELSGSGSIGVAASAAGGDPGVVLPLPADLPAGSYYLHVVADAGGVVFESDEGNNRGRSAGTIAVASTPADLRVTAVTPAGDAEAGQTLTFTYAVTNAGTGETLAGGWTDSFVAVAADGSETALGSLGHAGVLAAGGAYTATATVAVPIALAGAYTLAVRTDAGGAVYEADDANNAGSAPITITRKTPDLTVSGVTATGPVAAGGKLTVSWTVRNTGVGLTPAPFWYDRVLLTTGGGQTVYDLGTFRRTNPLDTGEAYSPTAAFDIPADAVPGTYFVRVVTDTRGEVVEPAGEGNNAALSAAAVAVTAAPPPSLDLAVSAVTAPTTGIAGQPFAVSWTVTNAGTAAAGTWYDSVYLSLDDVLDRGSDVPLGSVERAGGLAAGAGYTGSLVGTIPAGLTGTYTVFVLTDGGNRVAPETTDENNAAAAPAATVLTLTPPADLVAGEVIVPATATPGQPVTIAYTVTNAGANPAPGSWYDNLFLSTDGAWDLGDAFLGRVRHAGGVAAGASYAETLTAPLPGVTPGTYKLIVRTDVRNQVRETNDANNTFAGVDRFTVDVPALALGTPAAGTLADGQAAYYRVDVAAGEALVVTFDGAQSAGATELYVRFGAPPSRTTFDVRGADALGVGQRAVVGRTQAGTYYVLAYGATGLPSGGYTVTARTVQFSVFDTTYGKGGTAGNRTIEVTGVRFDRTVTAALVDGSGRTVATAADYYRVSGEKLYATFDLRAVSPGSYAVRFTTADGKTATVANGLEVVKGGGADVRVRVDSPEAVLRPRTGFPFVDKLSFTFAVSWTNEGMNDAVAPVIRLRSSDEFGTTMEAILAGKGTTALEFMGVSGSEGPRGILRPGTGEIRTLVTRNSSVPIPLVEDITYGVSLPYDEPDEGFDTTEITRALASNESPQRQVQLAAAFAALARDNKSEFLTRIAAAAGSLPPSEDPVTFIRALTEAFRVYTAERSGWYTGTVVDPTGVPVSGLRVTATNLDTDESFHAESSATGRFILTGIVPGNYSLTTPSGNLGFESGGSAIVVDGVSPPVHGEVIYTGGPRLAGTVTNGADGLAVPQATMALKDARGRTWSVATSDSNGRYSFGAVATGAYTIEVTSPGFVTYLRAISVTGEDVSLDVAIARGATVSGRLLGHSPGSGTTPILVSLVSTTPAPRSFARVAEDGSFTFTGIAPGEYDLNAMYAEGSRSTNRRVVVQTAADLDVGGITVGSGFAPSLAASDLPTTDADWVEYEEWAAAKVLSVIALTGPEALPYFVLYYLSPGRLPFITLPEGGVIAESFKYHSTTAAVESLLKTWVTNGVREYFEKNPLSCDHPAYDTEFPVAKFLDEGQRQLLTVIKGNPYADLWNYTLYDEAAGAMAGGVGDGGGYGYPPPGEPLNTKGPLLPDARFIYGTVRLTSSAKSASMQIEYHLRITVVDTVDFDPGNVVGGLLEDSANLERAGRAFDVPFVVATDLEVSRQGISIDLTGDCDDDDDDDDGDDDGDTTEHRGSMDPNDILGPAGYGDEKWVGVNDALPYTVRFENDPNLATAPAQVVRVTQTLDGDLDPRTFRLGDFGFGDTVVDVPDDRAFYQTRLDLRDTRGVFLDVVAGVNVAAAEVFWEFRSVDPATGDTPANPLVGFLPPNTDGSGQGFAAYTVKARKTAETGARVDAQARIVFDVNEPIDTPAIFNTIDARPPAAPAPAAAAPAEGATGIPVTWAANDDADGVGVRDYTVYVTDVTGAAGTSGFAAAAVAGGEPVVWLRDTAATGGVYYGLPGHTYVFTAVARDFAGNTAAAPTDSAPVTVPGSADAVAPTSAVLALPAESAARFLVSWNGSDGAGGSGVAAFDVYVSTDGGPFALWLNDTAATSAYFDGDPGRVYGFFSVAADLAGNAEALKTASEATTAVPGANPPADTGGITGVLYDDLNADGARQAGEPGLGGWTVFLDADGNGTRDEGEAFTTTAGDGRYTFRDLAPGTYTVAADKPDGWLAAAGQDAVGAVAAVATADPAAVASADCGCGKKRTTTVSAAAPAAATTSAAADALIGLDRLRADARFAAADGRGSAIVFLDTGLGALAGATAVYQYDYVENDFVAQDASGHGTGVAALARGVAPGADVIVLRVLDAAGRGDFANVGKALRWVVENAERFHIAVVNLSFGDGTGRGAAAGMYGLGDEFAALAAAGVLVVAAAGNNHAAAAGVAYPAADPNVLPVGAVFAADGGAAVWAGGARDYTSGPDRIASFSQRDAGGATLFAPGVSLPTVGAGGAAATLSGTSAAVPQVAGAAAVAQQLARERLGRALTPGELRALLLSSGALIRDGDDEQDNVANTGAAYRRLDVFALAAAAAGFVPGDTPVSPTPPADAGGSAGPRAAAAARAVVVAAGRTTAGADLGVYQPGSVSGAAFDDADADGVRDDGEAGRGGVTVYLDANGNGARDADEVTTEAAADGSFAFVGLTPGDYAVRTEVPAGRVAVGATGRDVTVQSGRAADAGAFGTRAQDATPPEVSRFVVQDGLRGRSNLDRVSWKFTEDVTAAAGDVTAAVRLTNLTTGTDVALTADQFRYDAFTRTLTWSLDAFTGKRLSLADGAYRWRLTRAAFADAAGNPLAAGVGTAAGADVAFDAHRLAGDVTGDGAVTAADLAGVNAAVGARPGQSKWDESADVDRDGVITTRDRVAVAKAQNTSVAAPPPPEATPVAAAAAAAAPAVLWSAAGPVGDLTPLRFVAPVGGVLRVTLLPVGDAPPAALRVEVDRVAARPAAATAAVPVAAGQTVVLRVAPPAGSAGRYTVKVEIVADPGLAPGAP